MTLTNMMNNMNETAAAPKLKRSPYLSAMMGGGGGRDGDDWSITSSEETASSAHRQQQQHNFLPTAQQTASGSRRKLRHALNEGSNTNRDYFNLRRPKGTAHRQVRRGGGGATSTSPSAGEAASYSSGLATLASSTLAGAQPTDNASSSLSIHSMFSPQLRRRVSGGDQQQYPQRRGSATTSTSATHQSRSNSLQYYYPNPFSTTNLRDLMKLQQQKLQNHEGQKSETGSGHDRLDTGWLDQLDRQDLLREEKQQEETDCRHEEEEELDGDLEEEEGVAPLLYDQPYNNKHYSKRRSKNRVPSAYRSLPQLTTHSATTTTTTTNTLNSSSAINDKDSSYSPALSTKKTFFQQVLDPIDDGSGDDVNSRRRNEAWKEIRLLNDLHCHVGNVECGRYHVTNEEGVSREGEVSDDECRVKYSSYNSHNSSGLGANNRGGIGECCMDGGGMVSDDNDVSGSEDGGESPWSFVVQKKRKNISDCGDNVSNSADSSSSTHSISADEGSSIIFDAILASSPPTSLASGVVPPRRVSTIGAGLAYGSDTWRSYQSKFDVRGGSSRLSSSLGR